MGPLPAPREENVMKVPPTRCLQRAILGRPGRISTASADRTLRRGYDSVTFAAHAEQRPPACSPVDRIRAGTRATYLRPSGRVDDLELTLRHTDVVVAPCSMMGGRVPMMAPEVRP